MKQISDQNLTQLSPKIISEYAVKSQESDIPRSKNQGDSSEVVAETCLTAPFFDRRAKKLGCQKIRPQEDSAQRRPAIFEKIRPRRREDSAPRLRRFGPPYAIVFLSVYFCNMFISLNDMVIFILYRRICKVYCQLSCCIITIFIG